MSKLSLPPLSDMPASVQAAFRSVASWAASQETSTTERIETIVRDSGQLIAKNQVATKNEIATIKRTPIDSDFIVRSIISNSAIGNPIVMTSSIVFRAGTSQTNVAIGAGGMAGSYKGDITWAISSEDGSFFFGKELSGADPARKQIIFNAKDGVFQFGSSIIIQNSAGETVSLNDVANLTLNPYTKDDLLDDLAGGVGSIIASIGSQYQLEVNNEMAYFAVGHKEANRNGTNPSAIAVRPALAVTAGGVAMGYNDSSGVWHDSVAIKANGDAYLSGEINATSGNFTGNINATSGTFSGTITANSIIVNSVTIDGVTIGSIKNGAALGATAVQQAVLDAQLSNKLSANSSYVLGGVVEVTSSAGGFRAGNIYWDWNGNVSSGSGVAMTNKGIVGAKNGVVTFSIDNNGTAVFKGSIDASQVNAGTFTGISVQTSGSIYATGNSSQKGVASAIVGVAPYIGNNSTAGVSGYSDYQNGYGVNAVASAIYGTGLFASGKHTGIDASGETYGIKAYSASGFALQVDGKMRITNSTMVANLNAEKVGGKTYADLQAEFQAKGATTGTVPAHTHAEYALASHTHNYISSGGVSGGSGVPGFSSKIALTLNGQTVYVPCTY